MKRFTQHCNSTNKQYFLWDQKHLIYIRLLFQKQSKSRFLNNLSRVAVYTRKLIRYLIPNSILRHEALNIKS